MSGLGIGSGHAGDAAAGEGEPEEEEEGFTAEEEAMLEMEDMREQWAAVRAKIVAAGLTLRPGVGYTEDEIRNLEQEYWYGAEDDEDEGGYE